MTSKVIFLDVDGTLTNYENHIPKSAIEAIKQAQANGHKVYTVTGRSKAEMYQEILAIGFDGYIGGNGSYIESDGQVLFEQVLSAEDSRKIVDWLHEKGLSFYLESNAGLFASEYFETDAQTTMVEYTARKGKDNAASMTVRQAFPEMIFGGDLYRNDLNKISFVLSSYQDYLDAQKTFAHLKVGTWGGAGETALFGDIGVADINKADAIERLLNHLQVDKTDTFAFGDAKIDIPMFEYCQTGVAMGNGGTEIKEVADYITDDVDHDGLWNAFKHFDLI